MSVKGLIVAFAAAASAGCTVVPTVSPRGHVGVAVIPAPVVVAQPPVVYAPPPVYAPPTRVIVVPAAPVCPYGVWEDRFGGLHCRR